MFRFVPCCLLVSLDVNEFSDGCPMSIRRPTACSTFKLPLIYSRHFISLSIANDSSLLFPMSAPFFLFSLFSSYTRFERSILSPFKRHNSTNDLRNIIILITVLRSRIVNYFLYYDETNLSIPIGYVYVTRHKSFF